MDGHNIKDVSLKSLRGQMGIVSQDIILFNGSIRDNIVYGKLNATDDEIIESAKAANAHDLISAFPDGYDSQIGERGVKLSGGQKQRIAIARALLKNLQIINLDKQRRPWIQNLNI
ncbi:ATP-binding cassette domain-containing protein [Peribacillus frigoritolerans]|uniref:ATP-binding cassette domain-containing protein n=1 Tax=Peribacillus frigoritolerans TaxID=450367 RepID=UPI003D091D60